MKRTIKGPDLIKARKSIGYGRHNRQSCLTCNNFNKRDKVCFWKKINPTTRLEVEMMINAGLKGSVCPNNAWLMLVEVDQLIKLMKSSSTEDIIVYDNELSSAGRSLLGELRDETSTRKGKLTNVFKLNEKKE